MYPVNIFLFTCFFITLQPTICLFGVLGLISTSKICILKQVSQALSWKRSYKYFYVSNDIFWPIIFLYWKSSMVKSPKLKRIIYDFNTKYNRSRYFPNFCFSPIHNFFQSHIGWSSRRRTIIL